MSSTDQQFLDMLASVPQDIASYGSRIADYIEQHSNHIASEIRDVLESATWLPESMRPPRSQPSHFFSRAPAPPPSLYEKTLAWVSRNRTAIAICVAFAGTTAVLIHRRRRAHARKRRAKKFANGAKREMVVLACSSFHDPLTRTLAVDLERRGYIVYVTVSSTEEDSLVQSEAKPDIRPLWMDLTSTVSNPAVDIHPNLEPIRELLNRPSRSTSPGSARSSSQSTIPQNLSLAGLIILPGSSGYPVGPFLAIPPSELVDTINTRLISSILTVQQFFPLLTNSNDNGKSGSSIVIAYPSIPLSLLPPYQVPSLLTTSSLSTFAKTLRREVNMQSLNIHITELKLGNFDLGSTYARAVNTSANASDLESQAQSQSSAITHWHSSQRAALQRTSLGQTSLVRGSALREFHNAVFDALAPPQRFMAFGVLGWGTSSRPGLVYVGRGARLYDIVGKIVPQGLVGWMMDNTHRKLHSRGAKLAETATTVKQDATSKGAWGSNSLTASESGLWEKVYV